ncbi:hypothetical protein C8R46DRAFT_1205155 [Mycena filopes]|nr:hypothetical protein C8R46DRAFT_1205155 [Mycena filopes]
MASVVQFTVDDSSPVIIYHPFGDTFGAPQLSSGWNPHWDDPGFSSATPGSTGSGTSLHITSFDTASFQIQWKGTGIKLFGNVTNSSYNITIDDTAVDAGPSADLATNTLLDINDLSDTPHALTLTVRMAGTNSLFEFDKALISAPVPPSNISSLPFTEQVLNDTAFAFRGDWSAHTSTTAGDSASLQFTGTSFLLRGSTSPQAGSYSVTLDNVTTSFSAKSAFSETDSLLFFASGLDAKKVHDLKVVNTEGATLVLPAGGASVFALQNPSSANSSASGTPSSSPSTSSALAQSGLSSGTIAALVLAGVLIFFIVLRALLYFLLYRPYRRRRLMQQHPPKDDPDQDAGSVLVVDVGADTDAKGYYYQEYNVPVAGPSRDRTSKRSGFAKWKEDVEGGLGSLGRLGIAFRHSDSTGRRGTSGSSRDQDYDLGATSDGGYKSSSSGSNGGYPMTQGKGKGRQNSRWTRRSRERDKSLSPQFKLDLPIERRGGSRSGSDHSNAASPPAEPSVISSLSYLSSPSLHATTDLPSIPSPRQPSPYPNTHSRANSNGALLTHVDLNEPEGDRGYRSHSPSHPQPPLPPLPSSSAHPHLPTPPTDSPRPDDRGSVRDYDVDDGRSILGDGSARIALRSLSPRTSEAEHRKARSKRRGKEKREKDKSMTPSPLSRPPVDAPSSHLDLEPTTPPADTADTGLVLRSTSPFRVDFDQAGRRASGQSRVRFEADPATAQQGRDEATQASPTAEDSHPSSSRAPFRLTPLSADHHPHDTSFLDFASSSEGSLMSRDRSNGYSSSSRSFSSLGPSGHWSTGAASNIASLVPPPQPKSRWSATTAPSSDIHIEGSGSSSSSHNFPFPVSLPASPHHPEGTFLPPPSIGANVEAGRSSAMSSLNAHPSDLVPVDAHLADGERPAHVHLRYPLPAQRHGGQRRLPSVQRRRPPCAPASAARPKSACRGDIVYRAARDRHSIAERRKLPAGYSHADGDAV